jgi:hypothetical protein
MFVVNSSKRLDHFICLYSVCNATKSVLSQNTLKTKLHGFSPQTNYTDRATAPSR